MFAFLCTGDRCIVLDCLKKHLSEFSIKILWAEGYKNRIYLPQSVGRLAMQQCRWRWPIFVLYVVGMLVSFAAIEWSCFGTFAKNSNFH